MTEAPPPMIAARDLTKRYGETLVVDGVSLELPAGGMTAIVGPNGAGKSTLLALLSRLLAADRGSARVAGLDVATAPGDALARRLSVLRQDNALAVRLTVGELVAFGRFPHSKGRLGAADREPIARALRFLDLEPLADRFLDELSGGQRQRAFVAMVLAQDTEVVLLDEPLNNLDMRHAVAMMGILRRAADELGRTIVVVLHDINFAASYCDRIVAMREGRVVADGSPAEIVTPAVLREVYDMDMRVIEMDGRPVCLFWR